MKNASEKNERLSQEKCPKCRYGKAHYLGSDMIHGNFFCATSDTEVTHYYQCARCEKEFRRYA